MHTGVRLLGLGFIFQISLHTTQLHADGAASAKQPVCTLGQKLLPVDQSAKRADFKRFRQEFLSSLATHDVAALSRVLAPNIKYSFGITEGRDGFLQQWRLREPPFEKSELWQTLATALSQGGVWRDDEFCFPYYAESWPESCDAFEYLVVTGEQVPLRKGPASTSPIVAKLSHEVVRNRSAGQRGPYVPVAARCGLEGYIEARSVGSPVGYRGCFEKQGTAWRLISFLAGD